MPAQSDAQRRVVELTTLNALAQTLNRAEDVREALEASLRHMVQLMALTTGWIFLRDETGAFRLVARHGLPPAIEYPGKVWNDTCSCQDLCLEGKLHKAVNMVRCSRLRHAVGDKRGLNQHASVPIRIGDETLGIMNVAMTEFGQFTTAQLQLLSAISLMLGVAVTRMRLNEQVKVRRVQEQAALLQLSQDLLDSAAGDSALQRLARVGARLLEVESCAFVEADEATGQAILVAAHGWRFLPVSGLPLALDLRNPHLWYLPEQSSNLRQDALETLPPLLAAQDFSSHLAQEVVVGGAPVGLLMINNRGPRQFSADDTQLLAMLASQAAQARERERLQKAANERQRLEQELDLARDIQASFLPDCCPHVPGYEIAAFYQAARQVGGDFYDFILLDEPPTEPGQQRSFSRRAKASLPSPPPRPTGRFGIVIADVTDKGVPAALFMALSRTVLRTTAIEGRAPAAVLEFANRLILADSRSGLFVTTFYGILDPATNRFTYANGGHNYPLLFHAATGEIEQLQAKGLVLGVMPDPVFEQRNVGLAPGDVLVFYTDGVTEAMNARRQLFDEQRLIQVLRESHTLRAEQIIERINAAVTAFAAGAAQMDDITLVVVKVAAHG